MSVIFTLTDILRRSISVSGGSEEGRKVHECDRFFHLLNIFKYWIIPIRYKWNLDYITNMILCWSFLVIIIRLLHIAWMCLIWLNIDLFFLNIFSYNVIASERCYDVNTMIFSCELLTWYSFHDLLECCRFFYFNYGSYKPSKSVTREHEG